MTANRNPNRRDTIALVGGGRWARVIASVLGGLKLPFGRVVVVSQANAAILAEALAPTRFARFVITPTVEEALCHFQLRAAIIANAARAHVESGQRMVEAGVPVLIEKPAALTVEEAHRLLEMADRNGVSVVPSLSYLHCSYLHRFAKLIQADGGGVRRITVDWADPVSEVRHGEPKSYDPGISVAQDVMPHIWAILSQVAGTRCDAAVVRACRIARGGRWASYLLEFGGVQCRVAIKRDAPERRRSLKADLCSNRTLSIDFSVEPGTIIIGSTSMNADPRWAKRPGPLSRQIQDFFSALHGGTANSAAQALLGSVALVELCDGLLKQRQRDWLDGSRAEGDLHYALRDLLSQRFYAQGRAEPGDAQALDRWIGSARRQFQVGGNGAGVDLLSAR